jgi:hypothetical protein
MSIANPLWGAPRIHGELLKLGIDIGQTSAAKYMVKSPPLSRSFLHRRHQARDCNRMFLVGGHPPCYARKQRATQATARHSADCENMLGECRAAVLNSGKHGRDMLCSVKPAT